MSDFDSPIFIVGCPRSGTTLIRQIINSHPHLAIFHESFLFRSMHLLRSCFKAGTLRSDAYMEKFISFFLEKYNPYDHGSKPIFRFLDSRLVREELMNCDRSPRSLVATILEHWARHNGKKRWGDKAITAYAFEIHEMYSMFPTAKFVVVSRDPRAVSYSLTNVGWAKDYLAAAYMWHDFFHNTRKGLSAVNASQIFEIRYEDLCVRPQERLKELCGFLSEEYSSEMLNYFKNTDEVIANVRIQATKTNVDQELIKNNHLKWRNHLSKEEIQTVQFVNSSLMGLCGYSTEPRLEDFSLPDNLIQVNKSELHRRKRVRAKSLYDHLQSWKLPQSGQVIRE